MKIDFKIDTASRNYDAFKGEMFAKQADGNKASSSHDKNEHPTFSTGRMDKATFTSTVAVQNPRYAVGLIQDGSLHIVPVKSFFQMRPSYSHFDKGDKRTKTEKEEEEGEEVEPDLKQVTVKFARSGDTEKIKKARERSYHYISQIGQEEPWCEAMIYGKDTHQSELERDKIPHNANSSAEPFVHIAPSEYFHNLIDTDAHSINPHAPSKTAENEKEVDLMTLTGPFSKRKVKKLQLLDQLKIVLRDAKVLSFNSLMNIVGSEDITPEKVLRNLNLCGIMVRGNWTLQSEILYPSTYISPTNGISSELMCKGRDYVLYKLMQNDMLTLNRRKLSIITQLPQEEAREILESVASLKSNKTWDLIKAPDYDFEKKHPEIYQRTHAMFKAQEDKFIEMESEKSEKRKRTRSVRDNK
jgi:DNA-directed RNA polymerase III subunit RPC5